LANNAYRASSISLDISTYYAQNNAAANLMDRCRRRHDAANPVAPVAFGDVRIGERSAVIEIIEMGPLRLKFLQSKDDTAGSIDMFEMTVQPNARMPVPHYHDRWDETIYGLTGTTTWRVDGNDVDLRPGDTVFIKRGIVHGFSNRTAEAATALCTLSPGVLGPQYFKDMASLLGAGAPDPAKMKETMLRYGLIPAPPS
jgi:quercetin dioxygenase-like cupin family protein